MKKSILVLIIALVISGAVWAQIPNPNPLPPGVGGSSPFIGDMFDMFSAVPTESTESRYSAGRFGSDIDDYIDVNYYDPNIGTFFFLGGFPANATVDATDVLTNKYALSFGLGKTLKAFYLGVYYGGSLVDAWGRRNGADPEAKYADYAWNNNLAVLVGTKGYGAFRLDMVLNTETAAQREDKDILAKTRDYAPSFALTWGGIQLAGMDPYVTIGFLFPDKLTWGNNNSKKLTYTEGSKFGLQAGVNYDLDDTSSLTGDLVIGGQFGAKLKGDREAAGLGVGTIDVKESGGFGFALKAGYSKKLEFGKVAVGVKPKVAFGFLRENYDISGDISEKHSANNNFEFRTTVDMGVKYQANAKVALFTGASLRIFDFTRLSHSGGGTTPPDTQDKSKSWDFIGIGWDPSAWNGGAANTLGFGMTVTPVNNLIIGCGLNTVLDKLFTINLKDMQIKNGSYWDDANVRTAGNFVGALGQFFRNMTFDLTVSYKY